MNISLFNIVVLQVFSDKKSLDDETIQCTHHVENCIHECTFYTFIDGHESKPAISIFRIYIIFSEITKLYPLQLPIEFQNV